MSSSRRTDTAEFKQEAVLLVSRQGLSLAEAARRLGIHANLLRTWKQSFETKGPPAILAAVSHQRHGQRAAGLGDQRRAALVAARRESGRSLLADCRPQRAGSRRVEVVHQQRGRRRSVACRVHVAFGR